MMHFLRIRWAAPIAASLFLVGVADAHPRLVSTSPAANSVVAPPSRILLRFSEKLIGPITAADVVMIGMPGKPHQPVKMAGFAAAVAPDGKTLALARAKPLPAGAYKVIWHAVSVDTHRVAGAFAFSVK
jgi:methionine-rich copper-binding protein CopC